MPSNKWLNRTVTISRGELAEIMSEELAAVKEATRLISDKAVAELVNDLLTRYSARVATEIFKSAPDDFDEED